MLGQTKKNIFERVDLMFDLKYHVATIVAVFLALAVGIVIGNAIIDDGFILHEQEQLIERLERDFAFLRRQNQLVKIEIENVKQSNKELISFTESIYPYIVKDRLDGYNVAIIKTCETNKNDLSVANTLTKAGACVKKINISSTKLLDDDRISKDTLPDIAISFAKKVIDEDENICLNEYKDYIAVSGSQSNIFDTILVIGNSVDKKNLIVEYFDVPLIKYFKSKGLNVIAGEFSSVEYSNISYYSKLDVCTIDNLDTVLGQITLILILTNNINKPIRYGIKSTAQQLFPMNNYN